MPQLDASLDIAGLRVVWRLVLSMMLGVALQHGGFGVQQVVVPYCHDLMHFLCSAVQQLPTFMLWQPAEGERGCARIPAASEAKLEAAGGGKQRSRREDMNCPPGR